MGGYACAFILPHKWGNKKSQIAVVNLMEIIKSDEESRRWESNL
jgi:hypothetical protein